jgi:hypothetical protein
MSAASQMISCLHHASFGIGVLGVEKVPTFNLRVRNGRVFVHPKPNPAGTKAEPTNVST